MHAKSFSTVPLALAAALAVAAPAAAHSPSDPAAVGDLKRLSAKAGTVLQGKVTKVVYKTAVRRDGTPGTPYTFVTYAVSRVLQGSAPKTVTLRFPGGSDGQGGFVDVSGVPVFEPGEEDILFVAPSPGEGCPLVMCEFGRFRIHGGAVYEAHGAPVVEIKSGKLVARGTTAAPFATFSYPAPTFEALMKNPHAVAGMRAAGLTVDQARAVHARAPKTMTVDIVDSAGAATARAAPGDRPVPVADVLASIGAAARSSGAKAAAPLASADPNAPLVEAGGDAAAAPAN